VLRPWLRGKKLESAIRELRDLTRYRANLSEECNGLANRVQKVLEDTKIKLASVATDALGASGRTVLKAVIAGEENAEVLTEMSKALLRNKWQSCAELCQGRTTVHHRFWLQELMVI
jgi:transposase